MIWMAVSWNIGVWDIAIIVGVVLALIIAGLYYLNKWATRKMSDQQNAIEKSKAPASIFVIDKRHEKAEKVNLPKAFYENMPRLSKFMKMYFVKAKVGSQIVTLMCEKRIYNAIAPQKNYKVELAGLYIVSVKGMKSQAELKQMAKDKKAKTKQAEKDKQAAAKAEKKASK